MAVILVDVDDTIVDLLTEWLGRYNRDFNDNVTREQITQWDLIPFVKPECGKNIYSYLDQPDLYDNLRIYDGAQWGIETLRKFGHRCVFLSAGVHKGKRDLLFRHGFITTEKDLIIAQDKCLVKGDYLLDDGYHNITAFGKQGIGILMSRNYNKQYSHPYRANNLYDAVKIICAIEAWNHRREHEGYSEN